MLISSLAKLLQGRLLGEDAIVSRIATLTDADSTAFSFIIWPKDIRLAKRSRAGCIIAELGVVAEYADQLSSPMIAVDSLLYAFNCLKPFIVNGALVGRPTSLREISSSASIHPTAVVGGAKIGSNTIIGAHAVIHDGAFIGAGSVIEAGVIIHKDVTIQDGCRIGSNSVIGQDAFVPYGLNPTQHLPSFGDVVIESNVWVSALCTIDRGLLGTTRIKKNTLIDSSVHVGHDALIGENVVIAAQSGFAGFARIEELVTIGGQVGVAPHVVVGRGARISGKSGVHCDIKPNQIWSGNPSVPHGVYLRAYGNLMKKFRGIVRE